MSFTEKNIYELLPSYYRVRDEDLGGPLKGLLEVIAREALVTQDNIAELYENWFIETCREWVVPYIGDLLGVRNLHTIKGAGVVSQRAYVANALSYRRRKGIAPLLEQLSLDVAGWRAHVTEFFQLLATTQYMNHIRLQRTVAPDLRNMNGLDLLNSAFGSIAHTADVRHISSGRGRYNIPNIGLFIWRLQSYPVTRSVARKMNCISGGGAGIYFTFSPLGDDIQLFNRPQTEVVVTHLSEEINVPGLLRRRALYDELEARRQAKADNNDPGYQFFDDRLVVEDDPHLKKHPVFEIFLNNDDKPIASEEILICNLEKCCTPPDKKNYKVLQNDGTYAEVALPIKVAVDPVLGRFIFTDPAVTAAVVSYAYGFSGDTGGGPYNRQDSIPENFKKDQFVTLAEDSNTEEGKKELWHCGVSKYLKAVSDEKIYETLEEAIDKWSNRLTSESYGIISIMDNAMYDKDLNLFIKEKDSLLIIAADWPIREVPDTLPIQRKRIKGDLAAGGLRPHIAGNINVKGLADPEKKTGGNLTLNGLLIEGKLQLLNGNLGQLALVHSTLVPGKGGLEAISASPPDVLSNQWLTLQLNRCITGPIVMHDAAVKLLEVTDSIIDFANGRAIDVPKAPVTLHGSTVLGKTVAKVLNAENCIFTEIIKVERRQEGCIRFSFVPVNDVAHPLQLSETPRKFRCQPELEITEQTAEAEKAGPITQAQKNKIRDNILSWLVPGFSSVTYDHYAYAQLSSNCPVQISSGADDGSEMGIFYFLKQPQRTANLRIALAEYLPLGLEAGLIYVT